jgi:hypothetical protein
MIKNNTKFNSFTFEPMGLPVGAGMLVISTEPTGLPVGAINPLEQ